MWISALTNQLWRFVGCVVVVYNFTYISDKSFTERKHCIKAKSPLSSSIGGSFFFLSFNRETIGVCFSFADPSVVSANLC